MSKIEITVKGCTGSGTSAIMQFISEHLEDYAFDTKVIAIGEEHKVRDEDDLMTAIDSIRDKLDTIVINEAKFSRDECNSVKEIDEDVGC